MSVFISLLLVSVFIYRWHFLFWFSQLLGFSTQLCFLLILSFFVGIGPRVHFILLLSQSVTFRLACCFLLLLHVARCFHLGGYGSLGFAAALLQTPISFDLRNSSFVSTSPCLCVVWFWWFVIFVLRKAHIVFFEVQYPMACFSQTHFTEVQLMYVPCLPLSS